MTIKRDNNGQLILVLGMHRSGTSAATRVLNLLGVDLGGNFLRPASDNPQGYWEHAEAVAINEKLLHALDRSWDDTRALPDAWEASTAADEARHAIAELIKRDFQGSPLWAIKDPRLCRVAPVWIDAASGLGAKVSALFVARPSSEVADSLKARDGLPEAASELSWVEHVTDAEYSTRALPRSLILYDDLLADWRAAFDKVASDLTLEWPKRVAAASSAVDGFLDKRHRHHRSPEPNSKRASGLSHKLYACCAGAACNDNDEAWASLSDLVDTYRQIAPTLLADIARRSDDKNELEIEGERMKHSISEMMTTIEARDDSLRDYERRVFGLLETVHGKDVHIQGREELLRSKDIEITRRDEFICKKDAEITHRDEVARYKDDRIKQSDELIRDLQVEGRHLGEVIRDKDVDIARREDIINVKNAQITRCNEVIHHKDEELRVRDETIRRNEADAKRTGDVIQDLQARAKRLDDVVRAKDAEIKHRGQIINAKDNHLQQRDETIREAHVELRRLNEALGSRDAQVKSYMETAKTKDAVIDQLGVTLREKDQRIDRLRVALSQKDDAIREHGATIEATERARLKSAKNADDLTHKLDDMKSKADHLVAELAAREARVSALELSHSWRITRPMRAFKVLFVKRRAFDRPPADSGGHTQTAGHDSSESTPKDGAGSSDPQPSHAQMPLRNDTELANHVKSESSQPNPSGDLPAPAIAKFDLRGCGKPVGILTTVHCAFVAELIAAALARARISSRIIFGMPDGGYDDTPHIVICPQMFEQLPGLYVSFQMEQSVSSRWFTDDYIHKLENSFAVLDYSLANIGKLEEFGLYPKQIYYMPIGYLPNYGNATSDVHEPQYDVLFYGDDQNERRQRFLTELGKVCKVKVHNNLFGKELHAEMAKAKLVVNIHYYAGALMETTRLWECLSLGSLVVSERSSDMDEQCELADFVDFVDVDDVAGMVARVRHWLNHESERKARIAHNHRALGQRCNRFDYYFYRFLLATDNVTFDQFWALAGSKVELQGDKLCLNLPEWRTRTHEFDNGNEYGFVRFPGLRHSKGWIGCAMSYKLMIMLARQQGLPDVTICEDDVEFPPDFASRWNTIREHLKKRHSEWDVFSGLMADLHADASILDVSIDRGVRYAVTDKFISTVFNVYRADIYDAIADWDEGNHDVDTNTIDRYLESRTSIRVMTTHPFLVGHKEEMHSTLWGFQNTQYIDLIAASANTLQMKIDEQVERTALASRTERARLNAREVSAIGHDT